jgi:hypothetical protein
VILRGIVGWLSGVLGLNGNSRRCQDLFNDHSHTFHRDPGPGTGSFSNAQKGRRAWRKISPTPGSAALQRNSADIYPMSMYVYRLVRFWNSAL